MRWTNKDKKDKTGWHEWFAWYPVKAIANGAETRIWLKKILRRRKWTAKFGRYGKTLYEWTYCNSILDIIAEDNVHYDVMPMIYNLLPQYITSNCYVQSNIVINIDNFVTTSNVSLQSNKI